MNIFKKVTIGIDIFNEQLTICGYEFDKTIYKNIEELFYDIKDISPLNFENKEKKSKTFFTYISKSFNTSFFKPSMIISVPEEFGQFKESIDSIVVKSGFNHPYFVKELIIAAIGCNLPYKELSSDGVYLKSIFILSKKNFTTFGVCSAGDVFESYTVSSGMSSISQTKFDEIVNQLSNKKIELSDTFLDKSYANLIKASLDSDINKTIYIMNTEEEPFDFSIKGFDIIVSEGSKSCIPLGLKKVFDVIHKGI